MNFSQIYAALVILLFAVVPLAAQPDFMLCYDRAPGNAGAPDTLLVSARSMSPTSVSVAAVSSSIAFDSSCTTITGFWSIFSAAFTTFAESSRQEPILVDPMYNGYTFNKKWLYTNARFFTGSSVVIPDSFSAPVEVFRVYATGTCTAETYLENEAEESLNQWADQSFVQISYLTRDKTFIPLNEGQIELLGHPLDAETVILELEGTGLPDNGVWTIERSPTASFDAPVAIWSQSQVGDIAVTHLDLPGAAQVWYRARYQDPVGSLRFSDPLRIRLPRTPATDRLQIGPNPTDGRLVVSLPEAGRLRLWDATGRAVREWQLKAGSHILDVRSLPAGLYPTEYLSEAGNRRALRLKKL